MGIVLTRLQMPCSFIYMGQGAPREGSQMNTKIELTDTNTTERLISLHHEWAQISDACAPNIPTTSAALARSAEIQAEITMLITDVSA